MVAEHPASEVEEPLVLCDEQINIYRRRYREARAAGLTVVEAELWADSKESVGTLRKLVAAGATPAQIRAVVL